MHSPIIPLDARIVKRFREIGAHITATATAASAPMPRPMEPAACRTAAPVNSAGPADPVPEDPGIPDGDPVPVGAAAPAMPAAMPDASAVALLPGRLDIDGAGSEIIGCGSVPGFAPIRPVEIAVKFAQVMRVVLLKCIVILRFPMNAPLPSMSETKSSV